MNPIEPNADHDVPASLEIVKPNVLVLEDEELMSALIRKYLGRVSDQLADPLQVKILPSGWELLTQDLSFVRVAVVDILLPRVTGVDHIRDFKRRYPHMGILPISGMATDPMKRAIRELLPDGPMLVPKPLRKEDFLEAFLMAWRKNLVQPPQTAPAPTLEAEAEPVWSAVPGALAPNTVPIVQRRLSRRRVA